MKKVIFHRKASESVVDISNEIYCREELEGRQWAVSRSPSRWLSTDQRRLVPLPVAETDGGVPMPRGADCSNRKAHRTWPCAFMHRFARTRPRPLAPSLAPPPRPPSLPPSLRPPSYSLRRSLVAQNLASNEVSNNCLLMTNWPHARNLVALSPARLMTRRRKDADHWSLNRREIPFLCRRSRDSFSFSPIRSLWIEGRRGAAAKSFRSPAVLNIERLWQRSGRRYYVISNGLSFRFCLIESFYSSLQ